MAAFTGWNSLFQGLKSPNLKDFVTDSTAFQAALDAMFQSGVRMIMVQNAKGTGDIFQVGAALCCEKTLGVLVISAEEDVTGRDKPGTIIPHYLNDWQIAPVRVISIKARDPERAISKTLTPLRALPVQGGVLDVKTVGHATNILLEKLGTSSGMENLLHFRKLLLSQVNVTEPEMYDFLERKGVQPKQHIIVLWSRGSGKQGGLHPNLDSSATAMSQLCARLTPYRTVIVAGDLEPQKITEHFGFNGCIFFGKFWEDAPFTGKTRACQLKLFDLLLSNSASLVHVGMRSGTLDSYALLKQRVIHIVDKAEVGQGMDQRMSKLMDDKTPMTYYRFTAVRAPKLFGQFSAWASKDKNYYPLSGKDEFLGYPLGPAVQKLAQVLQGQYKDLLQQFDLLQRAGNGQDRYRYFKKTFVVEMSKVYQEPYVKTVDHQKVPVDAKVEAIMELYEALVEHVLKTVRERRGFGAEDLDLLVTKILGKDKSEPKVLEFGNL
ncbi:MAG TPA: hypothetical protein VH601_04315 [Bryobacteraceae bacterium]|jgi:hypothetical protein